MDCISDKITQPSLTVSQNSCEKKNNKIAMIKYRVDCALQK